MSSEVNYLFAMEDHKDFITKCLAKIGNCVLMCEDNSVNTCAQQSAQTNSYSSPECLVLRREEAKEVMAKSDHFIRIHRLILSAFSEYFKYKFATDWVRNIGKFETIAVVINNIDLEDLNSIIDYMIYGQISVSHSRIHKFITAAKLLQIKGLENIKLIPSPNRPIIDPNLSDKELIKKLIHEKRLLEEEIRTIKESEKSKIKKMRDELELEFNIRVDMAKHFLYEEVNYGVVAKTMSGLIETSNIKRFTDKSSQTYNSEQNQTKCNELNRKTTKVIVKRSPVFKQIGKHFRVVSPVRSAKSTSQKLGLNYKTSKESVNISNTSNGIERKGELKSDRKIRNNLRFN